MGTGRRSRARTPFAIALASLVCLAAAVRADEERPRPGRPSGQMAAARPDAPLPTGMRKRGLELIRTRGALRSDAAESRPAPGRALTVTLERLFPASVGGPGQGNRGVAIFDKVAPAVCLLRNDRNQGFGAGTFIRDGSLLVTNQHVAGQAGNRLFYYLMPPGEEPVDFDRPAGTAAVLAVDVNNDLALLRLEDGGRSEHTVQFAPIDAVRRGMDTWAIGHPQMRAWAISAGLLSSIEQDYEVVYDDGIRRLVEKALLTHTPIDPGSSGGPLLDSEGRVIGINAGSKPDVQISNFAVAVDVVEAFVEAALSGGATAPPLAPDVRRDPSILTIERVYLSSVTDWDRAAHHTQEISLAEFYLYTEFSVDPRLADAGFEFLYMAQVQRLDPRRGDWVDYDVDVAPFTGEIDSPSIRLRTHFVWGDETPTGVYRFQVALFFGRYAASGETTLRVN